MIIKQLQLTFQILVVTLAFQLFFLPLLKQYDEEIDEWRNFIENKNKKIQMLHMLYRSDEAIRR